MGKKRLRQITVLVLAMACLAFSLHGDAAAAFTDVPPDHWAYRDIQELRNRGLVQGSGGTFRPGEAVATEAFLAMVCRAAGLDERRLESGPDWSAPARAFAVYRGWCTGGDIDGAGPRRPITRELAAQIAVKALFPGEAGGDAMFTDSAAITAARLPFVQAGVRLGLLDGYSDGRFDPRGGLTRAASAALLCRALRLREAALPAPGETVQVPILMYHDVSDLGRGYSKTPEVFRAQMRELKDAGFHTVSYAQLIDFVNQGTPLPDKPIVISIDDGYRTNYQYVFPILKELDMRAELSLVGGAVEFSDWGLKWDEVREMAESGLVAFQSHTHLMHGDYQKSGGRTGILKLEGETWPAYIQALCQDQAQVLERIEANTGVRPVAFTYPMGKWNPMAQAVMESLGFQVTVTTQDGVAAVTAHDPASLRLMDRIGMDFRNGSVTAVLRQFGYRG